MGDGSPRMLKEPSSLSGEWLAIHAGEWWGREQSHKEKRGCLGTAGFQTGGVYGALVPAAGLPLPEMPNNQGSWGVEALPQGAFSPLDPVLWAVSRWEGSLALPHLQFLPSTLALSLPT